MTKLQDLTLGRKLAIIVIALLVPSAWLLFKVTSLQQQTIANTELKLQGLEYMRSLWRLSGPIADHRAMNTQYQSQLPSDAELVAKKVAEIDAAIAVVDKLETRVNPELRNGKEWHAARKEWSILKDRQSGLDTTQFYRRHSALLETLEKFNERLATQSTLLFESGKTAHFLVEAIVTQTSHIQSDLFELRRGVATGVSATAPGTAAATVTPAASAAPTTGALSAARSDLAAKVGAVRANAASVRTTTERLAKLSPDSADAMRRTAKAHADAAETYAKTIEENMVFADYRSAILTRAIAEAGTAFKTSSELQDVLTPLLQAELESRLSTAVWERNATILGFMLLVAFVLALERMLRRQINASARDVVTTMERIANGEIGGRLTVRSKDEFGQALTAVNRLDGKLAEVVAVIRRTADTVGASAREISVGNDELSRRTQSQASALQQTASSMEEMTATVKQNADNANQANRLATSVREQAERGSAVVQRATGAMNEINSSSTKIGNIISVIDEIAFQTNLLALNAAVEAARAGEQGRGFAIVATEVRNLAQRSADAAKDIKGLIKDSVDKVKTGSELVSESGQTLAEILESVKKVTDIVAEIAAASSQQSAGIEQVNNAVAQMDAVTQENAARVDQASASSRSMQQEAEKLVQQISYFRLREGGGRGTNTGVPRDGDHSSRHAASSDPSSAEENAPQWALTGS